MSISKNLQKILILLIIGLFFAGCSTGSNNNHANLTNTLIITDIHFDPFDSCGESTSLAAQQCVAKLINNADASSWVFPSLPMNNYGEETNQAFFESALVNLSKAIKTQNIKNIFVTGDLLSHHFPTQFAEYVPGGTQQQHTQLAINTMNYVLYKISQALPDIKMYYILGNNDTDMGDYDFPTDSFMQQITPLIKNYMVNPESFATTFSSSGYSVMPFNDKVNVIGLNFNPLTINNSGAAIDEQKAIQQYYWLESQLSQAKSQGKKVIILQHEPFGMNVFDITTQDGFDIILQPDLQQLYVELYAQYNDVITNYYYGHYHMENFSVVSGLLSFSTLGFSVDFDNNPGFKILNIDQNGQLQNFTTYFSNYEHGSINWRKLYSLNEAYGINSEQYVNYFAESIVLGNNKSWYTYVLNYAGGNLESLNSDIPIAASINWKYYYCSIMNFESHSYNSCISSH